MFAEQAADFCSKHTFDKPPVEPSTRHNKRPIEEMTEEQQLQAAIRESMAQLHTEPCLNGNNNDKPNGHHSPPSQETATSSLQQELLHFPVSGEPQPKDASARVQIR